MRIAIIANYYHPETVGSGVWITDLSRDLSSKGHEVVVITSFPSYPVGRIFSSYRGRLLAREFSDGVEVVRTFTYATPRKEFWPRLWSFLAFCVSAPLGFIRWWRKLDIVYVIMPPLPLGVSAWVIAKAATAALVVNVQDIYPDIAVSLGYLKNKWSIHFFQRMERWIYDRAKAIVVISEGFRSNLISKGVAPEKLHVVPNWADPDVIAPASSDNQFRREVDAADKLLVLYSGSLSYNSELMTVLDCAAIVRDLPIQFAVVGDGVHKNTLQEHARSLALANVKFLPFQPIQRYAEVLAAADLTLVTLNSAATFASVPSKIYKQMAAARPILAITNPGNEIARLLSDAECGVMVKPGDANAMADILRMMVSNRGTLSGMGKKGRLYLERHCSRSICVSAIESALVTGCSG